MGIIEDRVAAAADFVQKISYYDSIQAYHTCLNSLFLLLVGIGLLFGYHAICVFYDLYWKDPHKDENEEHKFKESVNRAAHRFQMHVAKAEVQLLTRCVLLQPEDFFVEDQLGCALIEMRPVNRNKYNIFTRAYKRGVKPEEDNKKFFAYLQNTSQPDLSDLALIRFTFESEKEYKIEALYKAFSRNYDALKNQCMKCEPNVIQPYYPVSRERSPISDITGSKLPKKFLQLGSKAEEESESENTEIKKTPKRSSSKSSPNSPVTPIKKR